MCLEQKADPIFLEETNTTKKCESIEKKEEWGPAIIYFYGSTTDARCVAVLIRNGLNIVIQKEEQIMLAQKSNWKDTNYFRINFMVRIKMQMFFDFISSWRLPNLACI